MRISTQFILNYSKYGVITKILKTIRKQKSINKKDCIILIDITNIKISLYVSENQSEQKQSVERSKEAKTKSYLCCTHISMPSSFSFAYRQFL